jgi:hypothetical protein
MRTDSRISNAPVAVSDSTFASSIISGLQLHSWASELNVVVELGATQSLTYQ